jgi:hypothetical protein
LEQANAYPQQVQEWLAKVEVGEGLHHENLTVFPLFWRGDEGVPGDCGDAGVEPGSKARYQLLSDAVESKEALVEEVSEGGDVPFLGVKNDGAKPILIPEGEILIGAKQNRVVNLTVLVAAKTTFKLPVSCVEQGRWHYRSRDFKPAAFAHPRLRDLKVRSAQVNRKVMGLAVADQGRVWEEVEHHLAEFDAPAPTRDVVESYDAAGDQLDGYRETIDLPEGACGFVAARGGEVAGLDLFDDPKTMRKMWDRMSDAYFIEAARVRGRNEEASKALATQFIKDVAGHLVEADKQPDLGLELEVANDRLSGSALFYDGAVCHLSAFNSEAAGL